jgi:hypothetical protein
MTAYNFQACFAPDVECMYKRQTIRAKGKRRHARPGERVQLYTGQRTKACRKLVDPDPVCTAADEIKLARDDGAGRFCVTITKKTKRGLSERVIHGDESRFKRFARADGFKSMAAMMDWFEKAHGLPFEGVLIKWRPSKEHRNCDSCRRYPVERACLRCVGQELWEPRA